MAGSNKRIGTTSHTPFAGCVIMLAAVTVMAFLVGLSTWGLFRQYNAIEKFTAQRPLPVAVCDLDGRETQINAVAEKVENFRQELDGEGDTTLALTVAELNLIIAAYEPFQDLRATLHVLAAEGPTLKIGIAFKLNGKPRLAHKGEGGWLSSDPRYLNATMVARPRLLGREVVLMVDSMDVADAKVPREFVEQFSPYHIAGCFLGDALIGPAMGKLSSVQVLDGCLVLGRRLDEPAGDRIGATQVNFASARLFKTLGMVAGVFLLCVGVLLVAVRRAKARKP